MNIKQLSSDGKIAYLIKPILKRLQEAGGQLERSEIKARIADMDDQIVEFSEIEKKDWTYVDCFAGKGKFDDLVEYAPSKMDKSSESSDKLNAIAGSDYW